MSRRVPCGGGRDGCPHAEEILGANLAEVRRGVTLPEQLVDQVRVRGDILEALGHLRDAVEVGPETHVLDAEDRKSVV